MGRSIAVGSGSFSTYSIVGFDLGRLCTWYLASKMVLGVLNPTIYRTNSVAREYN